MSRPQTLRETLEPLDAHGPADWNRRDAAHLLRRTQWGATHAEIDAAYALGPKEAVRRILEPRPESSGFNASESLLLRAALNTGAISDLKAWWLYRMLYSANPFLERMTFFWHNHFATSNRKVKSVEQMSGQNALLREYALGDFRQLLLAMSRDVAMLVWLDSNANRKRAPNENYAREVMELFSLGVGNYSEKDIQEAARAFTGWHVRDGKFWFNANQHDNGPKTIFNQTGNFGGEDVVDLCVRQPACARFLAKKLLTSLVMPEPSAATIEQLAQRIRDHQFDMKKATAELLSSQLFFSPAARRCIIKSPLDLVLGTCRSLEAEVNLGSSLQVLATLGEDIFQPPSVKGWDGGRTWINSAMMLERVNYIADLARTTKHGVITEPLELAQRSGANDTPAIVRHFAALFFGKDIDAATESELINYADSAAGNRRERVRGLVQVILSMPDYQLG